jgi:hypothetical protein
MFHPESGAGRSAGAQYYRQSRRRRPPKLSVHRQFQNPASQPTEIRCLPPNPYRCRPVGRPSTTRFARIWGSTVRWAKNSRQSRRRRHPKLSVHRHSCQNSASPPTVTTHQNWVPRAPPTSLPLHFPPCNYTLRLESGAGWSAGAKNSRQRSIACWELDIVVMIDGGETCHSPTMSFLGHLWPCRGDLLPPAALPSGSAPPLGDFWAASQRPLRSPVRPNDQP